MKFSGRIDRLERDLRPPARHVHFEEIDTQYNVLGRHEVVRVGEDGQKHLTYEPHIEMCRGELIDYLEGPDRPAEVSAVLWGDAWIHYEDRLLADDYWPVGGGTWSAGETLLEAARRSEAEHGGE